MRLRLCDNWLHAYLRYTMKHEAPEAYHLWSGVSMVASALGRKCWFEFGYFKVHPNHYIMLIGESGMRKSGAADVALPLLESLDKHPLVLRDALSGKYLIHSLKKDPNCLVYAAEASTAFGKMGYETGLFQMITRLHDCPPKFDYGTVTAGEYSVKTPCVNILLATVPEWIGQGIPASVVLGGFVARFMLIWEDSQRCFPKPKLPEGAEILYTNLVHDLNLISKLEGPFTGTDDFWHAWEGWYTVGRLRSIEEASEKMRPYYNRKHTALLKLCIVLSAAQDDSKQVTEAHLHQALELVRGIEKGTEQSLQNVSHSDFGRHTARVMGQIRKRGAGVSKSDLLRLNSAFINASELETVLNTMVGADMIEVEKVAAEGKAGKREKIMYREKRGE